MLASNKFHLGRAPETLSLTALKTRNLSSDFCMIRLFILKFQRVCSIVVCLTFNDGGAFIQGIKL